MLVKDDIKDESKLNEFCKMVDDLDFEDLEEPKTQPTLEQQKKQNQQNQQQQKPQQQNENHSNNSNKRPFRNSRPFNSNFPNPAFAYPQFNYAPNFNPMIRNPYFGIPPSDPNQFQSFPFNIMRLVS